MEIKFIDNELAWNSWYNLKKIKAYLNKVLSFEQIKSKRKFSRWEQFTWIDSHPFFPDVSFDEKRIFLKPYKKLDLEELSTYYYSGHKRIAEQLPEWWSFTVNDKRYTVGVVWDPLMYMKTKNYIYNWDWNIFWSVMPFEEGETVLFLKDWRKIIDCLKKYVAIVLWGNIHEFICAANVKLVQNNHLVITDIGPWMKDFINNWKFS